MLSKLQSPSLNFLWLSNNKNYEDDCNIGTEGIKHLSKGYWPNL